MGNNLAEILVRAVCTYFVVLLREHRDMYWLFKSSYFLHQ